MLREYQDMSTVGGIFWRPSKRSWVHSYEYDQPISESGKWCIFFCSYETPKHFTISHQVRLNWGAVMEEYLMIATPTSLSHLHRTLISGPPGERRILYCIDYIRSSKGSCRFIVQTAGDLLRSAILTLTKSPNNKFWWRLINLNFSLVLMWLFCIQP